MQIAAGEFKAKCLKLMDEVNRTGKEITITKRGKAVAKLVSANSPARGSFFGYMKGRARILGDIVAPTGAEWEADK
jgi:prevent-host-death family protein